VREKRNFFMGEVKNCKHGSEREEVKQEGAREVAAGKYLGHLCALG
jgi:hypothetical protein